MFVQIDQASEEPIYLQLRAQIIAGIASGELVPGDVLPSVRALASDLGINLHTVNKAYAMLRDEGFLTMRGRTGAVVADPRRREGEPAARAGDARMAEALRRLAEEHKARGGSARDFLACVRAELARVYTDASLAQEEPTPGGS